MNKDIFIKNQFKLIDTYHFNEKYISYIFEFENYIIIIDDCFDKEESIGLFFDYSKYCEMQNNYMLLNNNLLRFNFEKDEAELIENIKSIISNEKNNELLDNGGSFNDAHIDNTPLEEKFEEVFIDAYGMEVLDCLRKEVSISSGNTSNYFIDYVIETKSGNYAFEENGVNYHHPLIVGKNKYKALLEKQNNIVLLGYKIFRFSTDNLHFKERVVEELKNFLSDNPTFLLSQFMKHFKMEYELANNEINLLVRKNLIEISDFADNEHNDDWDEDTESDDECYV